MLIAVLITAIGAAVIGLALLEATIQKRDETIKGLREQIAGMTATHSIRYFADHGGNIPIVVASRKALSVNGYMLSIRSQCTESLSIDLELDNRDTNRHKAISIVLEPDQTVEFGHFDDWRLSAGDVVELSHDGFNSVVMRFK